MASNKKVLRKEVAKMANVSEAVVSYVINNSNYVSKEKRERVLNAIEVLGYEPNYYARALKTNKSYSICVIVVAALNETLLEGFTLIEHVVRAKGYTVSMLHAQAITKELLRYCWSRHDGLIIIYDRMLEQETAVINEYADREHPMILLVYQSTELLDPAISYIRILSEQGSAQIVNHLKPLCASQIIYATEEEPEHLLLAKGKYQAVAAAAAEANCTLDLFPIPLEREDLLQRNLSHLFHQHRHPLAIVAENDKLALMILSTSLRQGYAISDDLFISGFGDSLIAHMFRPSLTSLVYDKNSAFTRMAEKLILQIETGQTDQELFETHIAFRDTTKKSGSAPL